VHCHFLRPDELAVAFINSAAFQRLQRALDSPPRCACDSILARLDRPHINPDGAADRHPVVAGATRQISRVCTRDERLGRRASGIDASAPKNLRSITATLWPAATRRRASDGPDCPVPMMTAS